ncbi:hypothetical protein ABE571_04430 [Stenotrophomonas sp. TWI273]|uniref:hypothetical protein n=1 Tax=Stenotrophomonas sp. TWI273 TaxID=3136774 RepID=UPI00320B83D9
MTNQNDTIVETFKEEVKAAALSRVNSPFLGAYLVSWVLWNHRMIFALFSGMPLGQRFHYIDEVLYPTAKTFALYHFLGPILSTIVYIFLVPWPTEWVHRWNLQRKLRLKQADLRADGHRLLTEAESVELQKKVGELRTTLAEMRGELTGERRKVRALSMKTLEGRRADEIERILINYVTSQPFKIRAGRAEFKDGTTMRFNRDGAVEITGYRNMRWAYVAQEIRLFDADQDQGALGPVRFANSSNAFEGTLEGLGMVQIQGIYSHVDFA